MSEERNAQTHDLAAFQFPDQSVEFVQDDGTVFEKLGAIVRRGGRCIGYVRLTYRPGQGVVTSGLTTLRAFDRPALEKAARELLARLVAGGENSLLSEGSAIERAPDSSLN